MSLQVTILKHKNTKNEIICCNVAQEYQDVNLPLENFPDAFKKRMREQRLLNHVRMEDCYIAVPSEVEENVVEIHHTDVNGFSDRVIARVVEDGIRKEEFKLM